MLIISRLSRSLILPPDVSNLAKAASTWSRLRLWQNLWNSCKIYSWEDCKKRNKFWVPGTDHYRLGDLPVVILVEKFESSLCCRFLAYKFSPRQLAVKIFVKLQEHFLHVLPAHDDKHLDEMWAWLHGHSGSSSLESLVPVLLRDLVIIILVNTEMRNIMIKQMTKPLHKPPEERLQLLHLGILPVLLVHQPPAHCYPVSDFRPTGLQWSGARPGDDETWNMYY